MSPNNADGMANSADPDQTAPPLGAVWSGSALFALGAVWSGSALFAQAYLSENSGSLRYAYVGVKQTSVALSLQSCHLTKIVSQ